MKHVNPKDLLVTSPESDTVRVLREARSLVSKGWCQKVAKVNDHCTGEVQYCMSGALCEAAEVLGLATREGTPKSAGVYYALYQIIMKNIPEFNDAPERTLEEVLDAFDMAIEFAQSWKGNL